MRGRKSGIYPKIARSTTMEKMMRPDPTDPTRLDQPTDRPTFTYMYMYTYVYIHICIEISIYIFFMCRVAELRGARAPCPDLLEKNFSPKPLFVGYHCAVHERHVQICWKKTSRPNFCLLGLWQSRLVVIMEISFRWVPVGTDGY